MLLLTEEQIKKEIRRLVIPTLFGTKEMCEAVTDEIVGRLKQVSEGNKIKVYVPRQGEDDLDLPDVCPTVAKCIDCHAIDLCWDQK